MFHSNVGEFYESYFKIQYVKLCGFAFQKINVYTNLKCRAKDLEYNNNNNNNNNNYCNLVVPDDSGYFTCIHNMKLVTNKFKSGGLHEKHVVATWNVGNRLSICL